MPVSANGPFVSAESGAAFRLQPVESLIIGSREFEAFQI